MRIKFVTFFSLCICFHTEGCAFLMLLGGRPFSKCVPMPASVGHGGGACLVPSRSPGPVEGDSDVHRCLAGRRMAWAKESLKFRCLLKATVGTSVMAPGKLSGPSYLNRSPAGSWHEHTQYLLLQLFPSYAKDQRHRVMYTLVGD